MSSTLSTLGEQLKSKRKELNLSVKEVENSTSIRSNYIMAIESGEVNDLLSPVYIEGFIKQYATFLGLDTTDVMSDIAKSLNKKAPSPEFSYGIGTVEMRNSMGGIKWMPILKWSLTITLILLSAYMFARYMDVI